MGVAGGKPTANEITDIVLPVPISAERWGPVPGRWKPDPNNIQKIPGRYIPPPQYEDHRTQLPLEAPQWPEAPEIPGPKREMGYEKAYDDGRMIVIRGPDEIYRRDNE